MSVGIGFDSGQDLHFFSDPIANQSKIVRQSIEIDLGPRWTARDFLLCTGHRWFCLFPLYFSVFSVPPWCFFSKAISTRRHGDHGVYTEKFDFSDRLLQEAFFQPKAPEGACD